MDQKRGLSVAERRKNASVLRNLACGRSNKEIAHCLYVSEGTVKQYVKSILSKLDVIGGTEAIAIAARRGPVQLV